MKEDFVLLIQKFAHENVDKGFTRDELYTMLSKEGYDTTDNDFLASVEAIISDSFISAAGVIRFHTEGYFRYLDYLEMKQAREDSRDAKRMAIIAIVISAIFALIQIGTEVYTIYRETTQSQYHATTRTTA